MADNGSGQNNGESGVTHIAVDVVTLTLQRVPWHLNIGGKVESDAVALAMLRQAVDYYEAKLRMANAIALQQQLAEQAENARVAAALRQGSGR